jgi:hypothetical protein
MLARLLLISTIGLLATTAQETSEACSYIGQWSKWSTCSEQCGTGNCDFVFDTAFILFICVGTKQKTRITKGDGCPFDSEIDTCKMKECRDGNQEEQEDEQADSAIEFKMEHQKTAMMQAQRQQEQDANNLQSMDPDQLQTMEQSAEQQVKPHKLVTPASRILIARISHPRAKIEALQAMERESEDLNTNKDEETQIQRSQASSRNNRGGQQYGRQQNGQQQSGTNPKTQNASDHLIASHIMSKQTNMNHYYLQTLICCV